MTVGEGIFYGALALALVALYVATKDRWQWKGIVKWGVGAPVVLLMLGCLGVWAMNTYEARAKQLSTFGGMTLASTEGDVRFAKGEPSKVIEPGLWVYYAGSGSAKLESAGYVVRFKAGKVRYISYLASNDQIVTPDLQGFTMGAAYARVLDKLGPPDHVATSDDGLQRIVSYDKLNTFYTFEKAEVRELGIYDPTTGPLLFAKAASAPQSAPSAPQAAPSKQSDRWEDAPEVKPILDHCAPGLSKAERMKRLAQYGTVRQTGSGRYEAGDRSVTYFEAEMLSCN